MTYIFRPTRKLALPWFPQQKSQWDLSIDFWIFAENKICGEQKFTVLTSFVKQDNLHKTTPLLWFLKQKSIRQKHKANVML